jgi:hypothetical protein
MRLTPNVIHCFIVFPPTIGLDNPLIQANLMFKSKAGAYPIGAPCSTLYGYAIGRTREH